jgi:predicted Zn-dependent protease with MMP-like domain
MIIVDFNQVMISNLMSQLGNHTNIPLEEGLFRHMVMNSLRSYNQKFGEEYGEIIIACDDRNYWRKQMFPYYKANRKKTRDASEIDWSLVFASFDKIKQELKDYFPYRVIQVETAEADDIIATLCSFKWDEKVLILSGDKDFIQLHDDVTKQYDPIRKKWINHDNPVGYLYEHILKGDQGDGIPNILSDDDVFVVDGKRQKPLTAKRIDEIAKTTIDGSHPLWRNWVRNSYLINLKRVPQNLKDMIMVQYLEQANKDRTKIFNYFITYKLKHLTEHVGEF